MKISLNTVFVWTFFALFMIFSLLFFIPYGVLKLLKLNRLLYRFTHWVTMFWGKYVFLITRCRMSVNGLENVPSHGRIIYIGNHQGYADIPFLMANLPTTVGFIAKKELGKIPILTHWMKAINCVFIDRGHLRQAMRDIGDGIDKAASGYPMVIFPEGTRSRSSEIGPFKSGSILLAAKAGITIVPVTINGTYKIFEENNKIVPAELQLTIHPSIETKGMNEAEQKCLTERLWKIIAADL